MQPKAYGSFCLWCHCLETKSEYWECIHRGTCFLALCHTHSHFLNSCNFHNRDHTLLVNLFLIDDKISLSKTVEKAPKIFTKQTKSTEVRKWRLWESCKPGTGSGKLQAGRVFPAYTLPLIAILSSCTFLMFNNQISHSLGLCIFSSVFLSLSAYRWR